MNADLALIAGAIVRVGDGRGFIVEASQGHRLVITAAHCLPHIAPAHPASYTHERTYPDLLGELSTEPCIWAECVFADLIADIAVLSQPDSQELCEKSDAFERFVASRTPLRVGAFTDGSPVWLRTLAGTWERGIVEPQGGFAGFAITLAITGAKLGILPGASGSPIVSDLGTAIGIISCGRGLNPSLADCLPRRLFDVLVSAECQKERLS